MNNFLKKYGPWALVTGTSSGIGEEFSYQLATLGFNIVLVARRGEKLEKLSNELIHSYGIETRVIITDLSKPDFINDILPVIHSLQIGLLVNNAGFALTGNFLDNTLEEELSLLDVNCRAPIILTHSLAPLMIDRWSWGIINVSSASAFLPMPGWTTYAASKAHNLYFSEGLWFELRERNIDVLALCPGGTNTEFSQKAGTKDGGMDARYVVRVAIKNLGKKSYVVPGFGNKLSLLVNKIIPHQWLITIGSIIVNSMKNR